MSFLGHVSNEKKPANKKSIKVCPRNWEVAFSPKTWANQRSPLNASCFKQPVGLFLKGHWWFKQLPDPDEPVPRDPFSKTEKSQLQLLPGRLVADRRCRLSFTSKQDLNQTGSECAIPTHFFGGAGLVHASSTQGLTAGTKPNPCKC